MSDDSRIEELKHRIRLDPASIAFAALAEEYRRAGRCEEAIAVCRTGLVRHPSYVSAHVTLGRALLETGHPEEAREELEHVLRVAPGNPLAIRCLAEIRTRQARQSEPIGPLANGVKVPSREQVLERLESLLRDLRRAREAARVRHPAGTLSGPR